MTQPRKLSSQARLRIMSRLLSKRHGKWYAAVEQSGLSASNFIFSLLVLRSAGVASLGEYGFWFVMCQLMAMTALGLAIRQMVLQSADRTFVEQRARFVATCLVVLGLQLVQAAVLATLISLRPPAEGAVAFAISVTLYTALLNFSELVRQYLYMRNRHRLSVLYTAAALSLSVFGFAFVSLTGLTAHPERDAFWFLAIGHGGYSLIVVLSLCASAGFWHFSRSGVERVVLDCWRYGRPATAGMAVTWIQNQSVTPMLMLMMGPIAVGYYQIARMIITPVNMITQGLSKSALPHIRRAYGDGDEASLTASIAEHMRVSMRVVFLYLLLVLVGWGAAKFVGSVDSAGSLVPLFAATVAVMVLSNYRFWFTQRFVVRLQFGTLLRFGIMASSLAVLSMFFAGYVLGSASLVILGSAVGELFLILSLKRRLLREL